LRIFQEQTVVKGEAIPSTAAPDASYGIANGTNNAAGPWATNQKLASGERIGRRRLVGTTLASAERSGANREEDGGYWHLQKYAGTML
jgi:hypothetical protein